MRIESETAHGAVEARDKRFDGLFFTGVTSTGIYCRCVCPARTPKRENRKFYQTAAAAERAGFRPCLICRPERAPGQAPIDAAERLAHDALKRIEAGALEEISLEELAGDLGVSGRHLRRVMIETLGAAPIDLAQTHRLLTAKRLLADSDLSMTQVAFASGFRSVRRFNALFNERYGLAPSRVRKHAGRARAQSLRLRLEARGALDPDWIMRDLARRQIAGVEFSPAPHTWARTLAIGPHAGWIVLRFDAGAVEVEISDGLYPAIRQIVAAVRGAFDLDADIEAIHAALTRHDAFAKREAPVRLPGGIDPFEAAIRAVLGQQVTLEAARTIATRLTARLGAAVETPFAELSLLFPSPARLAEPDAGEIAGLGMPRKRAETVVALARETAAGKLKLARGAVAAGRAGLAAIAGIGPWTLEYVALRGLGDPDAFPLGDSGLRGAFEGDLGKAHELWRPWRGYAAARLWARHAISAKDKERKAA
jgi:AraC family transcriptional regulator of adaptative response / DNA-3-methyladenine glycosylase II